MYDVYNKGKLEHRNVFVKCAENNIEKNNVIFEKEDTKDGLQGDVILQDRRRKWQQ